MIPALRRAAASHVVLLVVLLLLAAGTAVAAVSFTAETSNPVTFSGGWIGAPTALQTPTPSGYDAQLAWTPGTHGPVTGQQLWSADQNATSTCTGATYTQTATMAAATTNAYTQANGSSVNGHWYCYRMVSTSASAWTAAADFAPVQLGLVALSVSITDGGGKNSTGKLTSGDTITITFNQPVLASSVPTGPVVCTGTSPTLIIIGDTGPGNCGSTSDPYSIGVINGITVSGPKSKLNSTATVSGSVLTITLKQNGNSASGTGTFTPAATIDSAATTDQAVACTTATQCTPTTSGGF